MPPHRAMTVWPPGMALSAALPDAPIPRQPIRFPDEPEPERVRPAPAVKTQKPKRGSFPEDALFRFAKGTFRRIDGVLAPGEDRSAFARIAVNDLCERRESERDERMREKVRVKLETTGRAASPAEVTVAPALPPVKPKVATAAHAPVQDIRARVTAIGNEAVDWTSSLNAPEGRPVATAGNDNPDGASQSTPGSPPASSRHASAIADDVVDLSKEVGPNKPAHRTSTFDVGAALLRRTCLPSNELTVDLVEGGVGGDDTVDTDAALSPMFVSPLAFADWTAPAAGPLIDTRTRKEIGAGTQGSGGGTGGARVGDGGCAPMGGCADGRGERQDMPGFGGSASTSPIPAALRHSGESPSRQQMAARAAIAGNFDWMAPAPREV